MNCIVYRHKDSANLEDELKLVAKYCQDANLPITGNILDENSIKKHWSERPVYQCLKESSPSDVLIVYEAAQLACSTSQILEILALASSRRVHIHFVKYNKVLANNDETVNSLLLLNVIGCVESDFISKRTAKALARRRAAGLPLGRPKGKGNKSLKLDKHKDDIKNYLDLGISKASIAKLVDCHPQTLYDWLERNRLGDASENTQNA